MTTTPNEPVRDSDIETGEGLGSTAAPGATGPGTDADGTDADGTDA